MNYQSSTESDIFDRLCTPGALLVGFQRVQANGGGPGGDGETIAAFAKGVEDELAQLVRDLSSGLYRPGPLRRVDVPKRSGGTRRLSIPCVRDRVVQTALHELLHDQFEAEFEESSFGYRRGRAVKHAVAAVERLRDAGYTHVVDADIESFFDSVPHARLLDKLAALIEDDRAVRLVAAWLGAAGPGRGLPQGSPISPPLANLYLDALDEAFAGRGMQIVRFADDFLILCRTPARAERALEEVRAVLAEEGLVLHPEKTRLVTFDQGFRFLGHLFVRSLTLRSTQGDPPVLPQPPSAPVSIDTSTPGEGGGNRPPVGSEVDYVFDQVPEEELEEDRVENAGEARHARATAAFGDSLSGRIDPANENSAIVPRAHRRAPVIRPLYLYEAGRRLSLINNSFAVFEGETVLFAAPPQRVDRIEVGPDVSVESEALRQALAHEIPVVFADGRGAPAGHVSARIQTHGRLHLAQAAALVDETRALALASEFVAARLHNQRALLYRLNRRRKDGEIAAAAKRIGRTMLKLRIAETIDTVRGIEGEGGGLYWPALRRTLPEAFQAPRRERRTGASRLDVLLDFAAHLVTREIETLVLRHGLHPQFGILHAPRDSGNPVAWDLVEAFRAPLAEGFVVYVINNRVVTESHFGETDGGAMLFPLGRDRFIRAYEAWLARPILNPRDGEQTIWRQLLNQEVRAFRAAVENGGGFTPYRMGY